MYCVDTVWSIESHGPFYKINIVSSVFYSFLVLLGGYFCDGFGSCSSSFRDALVSGGETVFHCSPCHCFEALIARR